MLESIEDFKARIINLPLERQIEAVNTRLELERLESLSSRLSTMTLEEQMLEYRQRRVKLNPHAQPPSNIDTLPTHLLVSVSLRILELKEQGGPSQVDYNTMPDISQLISEHGDDLLYKSSKPGITASLFNQLTKAIAIMSFAPGGITIFGHKWGS